jgi:trans-2,3-dihydro-3-hydroxyanthranilate isomerase
MGIRAFKVDSFTAEPFAGNPAGVCLLTEPREERWMQAVAREMNLSETTFVLTPEGTGDARVRIFTPELELPFAGHPSVGTACELVRMGIVAPREPVTPVVLELGVGPTLVEVDVEGGVPVGATVHQGPPRFGATVSRERAAEVLGLRPRQLHEELGPQLVGTGLTYTVVPLRDLAALAAIRPVTSLFAAFEHEFAEVYPCAFTGEASPWVEARGLFPNAGIPEDPATGSAAGPLAAYMAAAGHLPAGERRVVLQGARIGRPSHLTVSVEGAADTMTDVLVGGRVQPVLRGELDMAGW